MKMHHAPSPCRDRYVVELAANAAAHGQVLAQAKAAARLALSEWQTARAEAAR